MNAISRVVLPAIWLLVFLAHVAAPLEACAPAPPPNREVAIASESAIIVWDAESKTEHFIRRATFQTDAPDFGFLVPTPTKPELAESPDTAFDALKEITKPKVVQQKRPAPGSSGSGCGCGAMGPNAAADKSAGTALPEPAVRVLDEKQVGGYDAVVLEADDPDALKTWLADHGYAFDESLSEWLAHYVEQKWIITAFKIAAQTEGDEETVGTSSVRMTFKTDRPFYPYREPKADEVGKNSLPNRLLRVYFVGEKRYEGHLGDDAWAPGEVVWSKKLQDTQRQEVSGLLALPEGSSPKEWWLTEFEDRSSPRPGTDDVYFSPSEDQSEKERPPIIEYVMAQPRPGVMACILAATMAGLFIWRRLRG